MLKGANHVASRYVHFCPFSRYSYVYFFPVSRYCHVHVLLLRALLFILLFLLRVFLSILPLPLRALLSILPSLISHYVRLFSSFCSEAHEYISALESCALTQVVNPPPRFDTKSDHVGSVMAKVALGRVSSQYLCSIDYSIFLNYPMKTYEGV
jgi:hypothetical protein